MKSIRADITIHLRGVLVIAFWVTAACCFASPVLAAPTFDTGRIANQATVDLHHDKPQLQVNRNVLVLEDPQRNLSIDEILSPVYQDKFNQPDDAKSLNLGYSQSAYWVKLSARNRSADTGTWWYQLDLPLLDNSEFFLLPKNARSSEKLTYKQLSYDTPLSEREIAHVTHIYTFELEPDQSADIYIRVSSDYSLHLPLFVYTPQGFADSAANVKLLYGIIMGAIMIMILYNGFMFISVKERTFAFYVLYMCSYLIFILTERVHGLEIFGDIPAMFHKDNLYIYIWTTWFCALLMGRAFLETKENDPDLDSIIKLLLSWIAISMVVSPLMDKSTAIQWAVFCAILYCVFMIGLAYVCMKRGNPFAIFYLTSWSLNFSGVAVYAIMVSGNLPFNFVTSNSPHLGIVCQMVIISFALADRIKVMQQKADFATNQSVENLRRYRSLFDNAFEGIFQISLDRRFIDANAAMARMLGFENRDQLITRTADAFDACYLKERDKQQVISQIEHGNALFEFEAEFQDRNGQLRWATSSVRIIYDSNNRPSHLEGTFVDITERVERANDRFEKDIAEASAAAKSRFLANMSHEIRTPLTAIIGYGETLLDSSLDDQTRKESSQIVVNSGKHLLALVNDILDHSKIDAEQMITEQIYVDLIPLFGEIKSFFAPKAEEKNIEFYIRYEYPLPSQIETDPMRFKQILINICANALKFTDQGSITLTARFDSDAQQIKVDVSDTGIGLKPEQVESLFDPFAQATPSVARIHGGTGLGLSISKRLCEMLGGSINVDSTYGEGSTFTISVATGDLSNTPLIHNSSDIGSLASLERKIAIPNVRGKILYAEDNELNCNLVEQFVCKTNATLTLVSNGAQALELVTRKGEQFDLILMDIQMPVMDGRDATAAIRAAGNNTPIIAVTANVMEEDVKEYIDAGCTEVMAKPIHKEAFYETLSRYLPLEKRQNKPLEVPALENEDNEPISYKNLNLKKVYGTVLVAEDNEINCRLISLYLTKIGVKIILAKNGEEAVKEALNNDVDLIIMDQHMPELEGPEAIQTLRQKGFHKPILAFTASDDVKDKELMKEAGCDGTVDKPIHFEQLYHALNEHLHIDQAQLSARPPSEDPDLAPIITQFIHDLPEFMIALKGAFEDQDWKRIRELSHQVIGMAGSLGFDEVADSAKSVELALKKGRIKGFKKLIDTFLKEAEKAENQYKQA